MEYESKVSVCTRFDREALVEMDALCTAIGITRSEFIRDAVDDALEKKGRE